MNQIDIVITAHKRREDVDELYLQTYISCHN